MEWWTGLDMVLVEPLGYTVREEVIIRIQIVPLGSCPLHVLLLSAVPVPVVHQAQNQMDPALLCFGYHIVQTLSYTERTHDCYCIKIVHTIQYLSLLANSRKFSENN